MFKHKALALDGVGFGHKVLAILGTRWFDVDIIITPPNGGGSAGSIPWDWEINPPRYTVKFVITLKSGKVFTSEHQYTKLGLETLEGVIAKLKSVSKVIDYIGIKVNLVGSWISKLIVKAKKS